MNKSVLYLLGLGLPVLGFGQDNQKLIEQFGQQNQINQQKFENFLSKSGKTVNGTIESEKATLAGFAGGMPVFNETDDSRANRSAGVLPLQEGTLAGLNNTPVEGAELNILVMDGGRIFEKHREFGADENGNVAIQRVFNKETAGGSNYAGHPTNVGGIIGAMGFGNFSLPYGPAAARGVLTKVNLNSMSFSTTPLGNNYQKLAAATDANVSNHSYGINLGWSYKSTVSSTYPIVGWYWIANYDLNPLDTWSGSYNTQDANFDKIVYTNPNHIVVKSAGNYFGDGPDAIAANVFKYSNASGTYVPFQTGDVLPAKNCSQGFYCIGWGSLAKNIIVVGATNQLTTPNNLYTGPADVVKSSYSSAGPRRDGAIKPDLSAVGSNHLIANYTNATTYNSYATGSGTSYAAPIVSGIAGAVTDIYRKINNAPTFTFKGDEMKVLLTHTANEAGTTGPDVWYGWGFVDATKAAQVIIDKKEDRIFFERRSLTSGTAFTKEVKAQDGIPIRASISWIDPAAVPFTSDNDLQNNHSSRLVNDLDLRIIDTSTNAVYYPYKLDVANPMAAATTGDNTVDNVEQVNIPNPVAGRIYRVEVTNKGTLVSDTGSAADQNFAIILTGQQPEMATNNTVADLVSVYPTRTKDVVNVLIPNGAKSIAVYDISGKNVLSSAAKKYQTIDFSNLPNGVYLINIETEKEKISKKIIKE